MKSFSFKSSAICFLSITVVGALLGLIQSPLALAHENIHYGWNDAGTLSTRSEKELQLIRVNSDAIEGDLDLRLILNDDSNAVALLFLSKNKPKRFEASELENGIVLVKQGDRNVVTITGKDFDPAHGGDLNVVYLHNAITGVYGTFPAQLIRTGDEWAIYTNGSDGRKPFTKMYLKAKRSLGQIVGIDTVTVQ